jgi:hypothetical protein
MAGRVANRRSPSFCADQQGLDAGGNKLPPDARERSFPKTRAMARRLAPAAAKNFASCRFGEVMKRRVPVVENNQPNPEPLAHWLESQCFEVRVSVPTLFTSWLRAIGWQQETIIRFAILKNGCHTAVLGRLELDQSVLSLDNSRSMTALCGLDNP